MTLKEKADAIAYNVGKERDFAFRMMVRGMILDLRAMLIRREYTKTGRLSPVLVEGLDNIPLQETSDLICESDIDTRIMRTKDLIPNPIRLKDNASSFEYVGAVDRSYPYTWVSPEDIEYFLTNRFTKSEPYYTFINKHIYAFNISADRITVSAAWGDPLEVAKIKNCDGESCFTGDFQLEEDMGDIIERAIYEKLGIGAVKEDSEIPIDKQEADGR